MMKHMRIALAALLALFVAQAHASFTVVNAQGTIVVGPTTTATQTISIAAGHSVIVWVFCRDGGSTIGSTTDSASNTYTNTSGTNNSSFGTAGYTYKLVLPSSITSVTSTCAVNSNAITLLVWDVTSTGTISVADSKGIFWNGTTPTGTDGMNPGTLTLTGTDGLLIGTGSDLSSNSIAIGTGFTSDVALNGSSLLGEHKAVSASGAATWTSTHGTDISLANSIGLQAAVPPAPIIMSNGHPVKSGTSSILQQ